jgi:hypothetical protein
LLAGLLRGRRDGRTDLASQIEGVGLDALVDDLLSGGFVAQRVDAAKGGPDALAVRQGVALRTGMPATFWDHVHAPEGADAASVAFATLSWALCVEFVHDLRRAPFAPPLTPAVGLPTPVITACRALARHVCDRRPDVYRRTADETEGSLLVERTKGTAEDLGKVDTFRFEEDRILSAALSCLGEARWSQAAEWAGARAAGDSIWLRDDPGRRAASLRARRRPHRRAPDHHGHRLRGPPRAVPARAAGRGAPSPRGVDQPSDGHDAVGPRRTGRTTTTTDAGGQN